MKKQLFLKIDNVASKKKQIKDDVLTSWVLDAIRKVFGLDDIRRKVLKHFISDRFHHYIDFGKTFGSESKLHQLEDYLDVIIRGKKRLVLFTASNLAKDGETHYQAFIMDRQEKRLWIVDPASSLGQIGIYHPYIALNVIVPYFNSRGYSSQFVKLSNPAQTSTDDIFCQTWSLLFQIQFVMNYFKTDFSADIIIQVPSSIKERYKYLITFYKKSVQSIEIVCQDLKDIYNFEISRSRYLVAGIKDANERKALREHYKAYDPCETLLKMNELDLMV